MDKDLKEERIKEFLKKLNNNYIEGKFGLICLKCGSLNIDESFNGEGGPVAPRAYTAGFDGKHFIKCLDCGNAREKIFYVGMDGAWT